MEIQSVKRRLFLKLLQLNADSAWAQLSKSASFKNPIPSTNSSMNNSGSPSLNASCESRSDSTSNAFRADGGVAASTSLRQLILHDFQRRRTEEAVFADGQAAQDGGQLSSAFPQASIGRFDSAATAAERNEQICNMIDDVLEMTTMDALDDLFAPPSSNKRRKVSTTSTLPLQ